MYPADPPSAADCSARLVPGLRGAGAWRLALAGARSAWQAVAKAVFGTALLVAGASPALAQPVRTGHVTAELVAREAGVQPGGQVAIGLRLQHIPHWHTYWRNPGDSGLPTTLGLDTARPAPRPARSSGRRRSACPSGRC